MITVHSRTKCFVISNSDCDSGPNMRWAESLEENRGLSLQEWSRAVEVFRLFGDDSFIGSPQAGDHLTTHNDK